jgi:hypothetical protein
MGMMELLKAMLTVSAPYISSYLKYSIVKPLFKKGGRKHG